MFKRVLAPCLVCLCMVAAVLQAQDVFVLPGTNSNSQNVFVFTTNPFVSITSFSAGAGAFQVFEKPDGTKLYAVSNSGSATVTSVDNSFAAPHSLGNLGQQATAAVLTPDGRRLAVAAGLLHIFDTSSDTDLFPSGISTGPAVSIFDVAVTLDGKAILTLGLNPAGGSQLAAVDPNSGTVIAVLPIQGGATGLSVGPNGLIYVSTQNQILEVNPNTLMVTPGGPIVVNARPGKLAFTPDGLYAVTVNQTPITGSAVLLLSLANHAIVNTVPNFGVTLDRMLVINSTTFLGYSVQNESLYQVTLSSTGNFSINAFSLPGITTTNVTAFALSNEVPVGGRSFPQYLFVVSNGTLYRLDLTTNAITGQFPLVSGAGGALSFAAPAITGVSPVTLLQYGGGQTIAVNSVSQPIVVRALDQNGRPVSGATVNFTTNASGASLNPASPTTGADGYAVTYLTAPSTSGPVIVTGASGTQSVAFNINVGTSTTGGGQSGSMVIVAGQGQIVFENNNTGIQGFGSPLIVQVNDTNGRPLPGAAVTFTITSGQGTILGSASSNSTAPNTIVVNTDSNGQASVNFLSSNIGATGTGYAQTSITASSPGTNTLTFYITTTQQSAPPIIQLQKPDFGATIVGQAGTTIPGGVVIIVASSLGLPIPNVGVQLNNGGLDPTQFPSAMCANPTGTGLLTDSTGTAKCDLVLNGKLGTATEFANVGYFLNTRNFNVQITPGPPGTIHIVQGNNQSGSPGQQLPIALKVQITDAFGNILPGVPVTWSAVTPGTVTLSNIISPTDLNGNSSAIATLGNIAGSATVKVTAGNATASFTLNVSIPIAGLSKVSGDGQSTVVNTAFSSPLVVKVTDKNGAGVAGAQVTFQVTQGTATLGTQPVTTDANGQASTNVTAGATSGTVSISATVGTFSVSFTLTSRLPGPANVQFQNGASFLSGQISPGGIAIITGSGLLPGVQGVVPSINIVGQLPTSLSNGFSVAFNGIAAPIYYIANVAGHESAAVQVPFETPTGSVTVTVNAANGGSTTTTAQVQAYAPGVFTTSGNLAVVVRPDGSFVGPNNPARRGENIQVYVTGLGQTSPATATNFAGLGQSVSAAIVVGLNNAGVPLVAAQYAPGLVGVYVVTMTVPSNTPTGASQPLAVGVVDAQNNVHFGQGTSIPIQ